MPVAARPAVAPWVLALAFTGAVSALAGGFWDDAWHTERGRDAFLIAPHVAIYAGLAAVGGALTAWAVLAAREHGIAVIRNHKPLLLALLGVAATLLSAPIDNAWHIAFGRDAVIWSPPHMLGIAGTMTLAAALLAELAGRAEAWAPPATVVAGALVLSSATFVAVEYDTDVPQFDVTYYLPALGFAASIALVLVRLAVGGRWTAVTAAAVHAAFVGAVAAFLALAGFAAPALPLLLLPAIALDIAAHRRWSPWLAAAWWTVALHAAYVPVRNFLGEGVRFDVADVVVSVGLTWLAAVVVFATAARDVRDRPSGRPAVAYLALAIALLAAPAAIAHDPGQGDDAGTVGLVVAVDRDRARLTATLPASECESTEPVEIVARRAGHAARARLVKRTCTLSGDIQLPERGRWFIYALMRREGRTVESWLPVTRDDGTVTGERRRYAYYASTSSGGLAQIAAGVALYAAMAALILVTFKLVRASRPCSYTPSE